MMTECETIIFVQKALEFAIKVAEQTGIHNDKNYGQARDWLKNQRSRASSATQQRGKNGASGCKQTMTTSAARCQQDRRVIK